MKKYIYLCGMMLLSANMMAQIDLNDRNWNTVFYDDFTQVGRSWHRWTSSPDKKWRAYPGYGVTCGANWYHVYQYANSLFCPDEGVMKIIGRYCDTICYNNYPLPGWMHGNYPPCDSLFYFSGNLDANPDSMRFQYGYFEIRCKMPKHSGAHACFWLQSANKVSPDTFYEEIDIAEYSWSAGDPGATYLHVVNPNATVAGDPRFYSTAIIYNETGHLVYDTDIYTMSYPHIPNGQEDVSGWHTYSCEWMPDHVYVYLDGNLVSSFFDKPHIPRHHLTLKASYGIDGYAVGRVKDEQGINHYFPEWMGNDTLTIDYIKVYQLDWDCGTDETITCQNDLNGFLTHPSVKHSISVSSTNETITVNNTDKITFRVADSFEITGPFQANNGCEFTVIRQDCPE